MEVEKKGQIMEKNQLIQQAGKELAEEKERAFISMVKDILSKIAQDTRSLEYHKKQLAELKIEDID